MVVHGSRVEVVVVVAEVVAAVREGQPRPQASLDLPLKLN